MGCGSLTLTLTHTHTDTDTDTTYRPPARSDRGSLTVASSPATWGEGAVEAVEAVEGGRRAKDVH